MRIETPERCAHMEGYALAQQAMGGEAGENDCFTRRDLIAHASRLPS
jgi:hypothetical protein